MRQPCTIFAITVAASALLLLLCVNSAYLPACARDENDLKLRGMAEPNPKPAPASIAVPAPLVDHAAGANPANLLVPNAVAPIDAGSASMSSATAKPLSAIIGRDIDLTAHQGTAPSANMKALRVTVHNRSDDVVVFDGDHSAIARDSTGVSIKCLTQHDLDAVGRPPTTFKGKLSADVKDTVTAAVSVGVVQTTKTILREHGPIQKRYEYDEERRTNEQSRFGQRLLYPGDSTDGNIYFDAGTVFDGQTLSIPVKSFYNNADQAFLTTQIR